jgi:hypothetical protein
MDPYARVEEQHVPARERRDEEVVAYRRHARHWVLECSSTDATWRRITRCLHGRGQLSPAWRISALPRRTRQTHKPTRAPGQKAWPTVVVSEA